MIGSLIMCNSGHKSSGMFVIELIDASIKFCANSSRTQLNPYVKWPRTTHFPESGHLKGVRKEFLAHLNLN